MKIIYNFLRNSDEIVRLAKEHYDLFRPREGDMVHESIIPGLKSRFSTLKDVDMSKELIDAIFKDADFDADLRDFFSFIQIQKYNPGEFICPHKDLYFIRCLHLIILTKSNEDGLVLEDGNGGLVKIYDEPGTYIDVGDAYHWVDPIHSVTRYSLVIGN